MDVIVLICRLQEEGMTRDGYLFRANEVCEHLYFIWKGAIEFVVEEEDELIVTKTLDSGNVVGELSFFFGMKQTESARSKMHSPGASLFVLKREDFKELARLYPQQEQVIVKKVRLGLTRLCVFVAYCLSGHPISM
jgi:CRP-like cAMP-binding protein